MTADQLTLPLDQPPTDEPDDFHDWMLWLRQDPDQLQDHESEDE
jgi:hypothetical protein